MAAPSDQAIPARTKESDSEALTECPLCGTPLENPTACDRCDWVKGYRHRKTDRGTQDLVALMLSIVPGLGHLYKGHLATGVLFLVGTVVAVLLCSLFATFTMGFGLLLLPLYWIWVMTEAYWITDQRTERTA